MRKRDFMKKIIVLLILIILLIPGGEVMSMQKVSSLVSKDIGNYLTNKAIWSNLMYNVKAYGARGDGINDDTIEIQSAINACYEAGGGIVIFPAGTYLISSSLIKKEKVSLLGVGTYSVTLKWITISGGTIIDTTNQRLSGTNIEGMTITKASNVTGDVTGLLGGSAIGIYNSTGLTVRNVRFYQLKYGTRGNGAPDIGIYDSIWDNVTAEDCYYGLMIHGSQNTIRFPRILDCDYGLVMAYLSNASFAGVQVFGGIFIGNGVDIYVPVAQAQTTRPSLFEGVWFEGATTSIVKIEQPASQLMSWTFVSCMLSANTTGKMMDFTNAYGSISVVNSTIYQTNAAYSKVISKPSSSNGLLSLINVFRINSNGTTEELNRVVSVIGGGRNAEQSGSVSVSCNTGVWTSTNVTFDTPFYTEFPIITGALVAFDKKARWSISSLTSTGFTINIFNDEASTTAFIFHWIAKDKDY